jgi:hypothetical protein
MLPTLMVPDVDFINEIKDEEKKLSLHLCELLSICGKLFLIYFI